MTPRRRFDRRTARPSNFGECVGRTSSRCGPWLFAPVVTSGIYLVQTDAEQLVEHGGRCSPPWLHTSALSVFAVLAVVVAVVHRAVARRLDRDRRTEEA